MTERQSFIAAICAQPEDDTTRLVFADWLEESGELERAEFIRVQCKIATIASGCLCGQCHPRGQHHNGPCAVDREDRNLRRRERDLLVDPWKTSWLGEAVREATIFGRASPDQVSHGLRWKRGFVVSIACAWADWRDHHSKIAWHPSQNRECPETAQPIEEVRLTTLPEREWCHQNDPVLYFVQPSHDVTARSALFHRWPWIKFTLPTVTEGVVNEGIDRSYARDQMEADARAAEEIVREIARRTGIRLPAEAARMVRVETPEPTGRPPFQMICSCERWGVGFTRMAVDVANPPVYNRVVLDQRGGWLANLRTVQRRWSFTYGMCDRCGVVYFSIRREPDLPGTPRAGEPRRESPSRT